jgi:hypothetical protein
MRQAAYFTITIYFMSKVLEASCVANIVTCGGVPIVGAEILSSGIGPSSGLLIIDGEKSYYVAVPSLDIGKILDLIALMSDSISLGIIGTHSTVSGVNATVDVAAALTVAMTAIKAQAIALKAVLQ